ncbi:unnamed protein product, partial [Linum tenue]
FKETAFVLFSSLLFFKLQTSNPPPPPLQNSLTHSLSSLNNFSLICAMSCDSNNGGSGSSSSSWLGFSLSPHMKMDADNNHHHQHYHHTGALYLSGNNPSPGISYDGGGGGGGGAGFHHHSPLTVMPLKSDGSLCIMEALSRSQPPSQGMAPPQSSSSSSSPKLEDFLGGGHYAAGEGGHHHGGADDRDAFPLSLDSFYFNHQPTAEEGNNHRQQQQHLDQQQYHQFQTQTLSYYPGIQWLQQAPPSPNADKNNNNHIHLSAADSHSHLPPTAAGEIDGAGTDEIPTLRNCWVSRYIDSNHHQIGGGGFVDEAAAAAAAGCGGELQSLTLSMSPGSKSSCVPSPTNNNGSAVVSEQCMIGMESKKRALPEKSGQKQTVHRKSIDTFGQRTSQYRGVTRHRWTGRYEAHLWDNSCKKEGQTRKGRQGILGGYDMEEKAARAYDLAALKYWGPSTHINFPLENYRAELEEMKNMSRQEYVAHLRRKSSGFSRGASMYRGVTRHHQHGRWQARIGRVAGNKDLYLGTFSTQEEAAEAYDIAAIKFRGVNAVTNFDITRYDVEKIMASNTLLAGELARRNSEVAAIGYLTTTNPADSTRTTTTTNNTPSPPSNNNVNNGNGNGQGSSLSDWNSVFYGTNHSASSSPYMLHDLIGVESLSSGHAVEDSLSAKLGAHSHSSNPSSLVTSLSSSREGSPDKVNNNNNNNTTTTANTMLFAKPPLASKFISPAAAANQMRESISMAHLPVFAAWNDA